MKSDSKTKAPESMSGPDWPEVGTSGLDEGDVSQIRSMLVRTPTERLQTLQEKVDGLTALRNGRVERQ